MKIRIVLWTLCMAVAGFMLATSTPSIPSLTLLGLFAGAATGVHWNHVHSQSQTQTYLVRDSFTHQILGI